MIWADLGYPAWSDVYDLMTKFLCTLLLFSLLSASLERCSIVDILGIYLGGKDGRAHNER
jgi:hypothetical protein